MFSGPLYCPKNLPEPKQTKKPKKVLVEQIILNGAVQEKTQTTNREKGLSAKVFFILLTFHFVDLKMCKTEIGNEVIQQKQK